MAFLSIILIIVVPISVLALLARAIWRAWSSYDVFLNNRFRIGISEQRFALEQFVLAYTARFQGSLIVLSLLSLPSAWLLLEIPKHIINHALSDDHGVMTFLGLQLAQVELLFALCASYLAFLGLGGMLKFLANQRRGRISERLIRRLRLKIIRAARQESNPDRRSALAAVAVQEVEPVGYFGGSLTVVPLLQGGTLIVSISFLLAQNIALALAALCMLPVQLIVLPRLQRNLNAIVRERVLKTRGLSSLMLHNTPTLIKAQDRHRDQSNHEAILAVKELESIRVRINDQKGFLKGTYNFTSNLTPFFFFTIGGYLVIQDKLTVGALVAALAAYREVAPALRELFQFSQSWSDARARFEEITRATTPTVPPTATLHAAKTGTLG